MEQGPVPGNQPFDPTGGQQPPPQQPQAPYQGQGYPGQGYPPAQQYPPQQQVPQQQYPTQQYTPPQYPPQQYPPQQYPVQPAGSTPQPGYGATPYPQAPHGQPGAGPNRKSNKALYLGLLALLVVAGLVVGAVLIFTGGSDSSPGKQASPDQTVTEYLKDLSKGDANAALALGPAPASKLLLTDAVLKQQQAMAKISGVRVVDARQSTTSAAVHVTYTFGSVHADETYILTKRSSKWSLEQTTVPIDLSNTDGVPPLTIFGIKVAGQQKVYVFPGPVKYGTTDPNFTITRGISTGSDKFPTAPDGVGPYVSLQAVLSPTGRTVAAGAVQTAMQACAASNSLHPTNCPQDSYTLSTGSGYPVDNTARWTAPTDYSLLKFEPGYTNPQQVRVSGMLTFRVTLQVKDFNDKVSTQSGSVNANLYGTVDLSVKPAKYTNS